MGSFIVAFNVHEYSAQIHTKQVIFCVRSMSGAQTHTYILHMV
jgi:hypothetical protein